MFHRLGALVGGWTLEAAEVAAAGDDIEPRDVLDLLAALVDKSLALSEERDGEMRYPPPSRFTGKGIASLRGNRRKRVSPWDRNWGTNGSWPRH
jgi:hypothetical protein